MWNDFKGWFLRLLVCCSCYLLADKLLKKKQTDLRRWKMVEVNSAMKVIVCECQAGREGQMYLIWFTQTLEAGCGGWRASWVSWQALNLEPLLLFRYAYSLTVAKFAKVSRIRAAGDESREKDSYQERTELLWECFQVVKCTQKCTWSVLEELRYFTEHIKPI